MVARCRDAEIKFTKIGEIDTEETLNDEKNHGNNNDNNAMPA